MVGESSEAAVLCGGLQLWNIFCVSCEIKSFLMVVWVSFALELCLYS